MNFKNLTATFLLLAICFACSSDDDSNDNNSNTNSAEQVAQIAESGTWRISSFIDSGQDETSDFNGYTFTFNNDGTLVASNGTNTIEGSWSVMDDNSNDSSDDDGNSTDDDDFIINFPVPESNDFEDLNDDWDIVSVTTNRIELIDISGGNGGTDNLVFEK